MKYTRVKNESTMLEDWLDVIVIFVYKGRVVKRRTKSYREVSVQSVVGMINV